jgi:uncharacterized damage-inducible protein DinB
MISTDHLRLMARYNQWQNRSLFREAAVLEDAARRLDRGSYFKSIHGTLSHLMWGDQIWMHRFSGSPKPSGGIKDSQQLYTDWNTLSAERIVMDQGIIHWAESVSAEWLAGELTWFSGATGREMSKKNWLLATHFFNHQTHHRGQVHAMLTAAGLKPDDTDLMLLET